MDNLPRSSIGGLPGGVPPVVVEPSSPDAKSSPALLSAAPSSVKKTMSKPKGALPSLKRSCPNPNSETDTVQRTSFWAKVFRNFRGETKFQKIKPDEDLPLDPGSRELTPIDLKDPVALEKILKECTSKLTFKDRFDAVVAPAFKVYVAKCKEKTGNIHLESFRLLRSIVKYEKMIKDEKKTGIVLLRETGLAQLKESIIQNFLNNFPSGKADHARAALEGVVNAYLSGDNIRIRGALDHLVRTINEHKSAHNEEVKAWLRVADTQGGIIDRRLDVLYLDSVKNKLKEMKISFHDKISLNDALSLYIKRAFFKKENIEIINKETFDSPDIEGFQTLYDTYKAAHNEDQFVYFCFSHIFQKLDNGLIPIQLITQTFNILLKELEEQKTKLQGGVAAGRDPQALTKIEHMIHQINACKNLELVDLSSYKKMFPQLIFKELFIELCKEGGCFQINFGTEELNAFAEGMQKADASKIIAEFDRKMLGEAVANSANYKTIPLAQRLQFLEKCCKDIVPE